jgi:phenylpropionate dioxygenase-like ring-hydroxylating dioxygenase large terminal subunit
MHDREYDVLRHIWFPIARISDLRKGITRGNILGHELVIYQTGDTVTVADRWCPHRGMALEYGRMTHAGVECPYHGWVFAAGSGKCVAVPSLPQGARLPPASLKTYPNQVAHGLVWSCLEEPVMPIPDLPVGDRGDVGGWDLFAGLPHDLRCGMRQLTENFRDRAHFPFVHKRTMGEISKVVDSYHVARDDWQLTWSSAMTTIRDQGGVPDPVSALNYRTVLPMFASVVIQSSQGVERLVVQLATPIAADGESVRQFWIVGIHHSDNTEMNTIEAIANYEAEIFKEDHWILQNQSPAESPLDLKSQVHTVADQFSIVYRRTYLEMLEFFGDQCESMT